MLTQSICMVAVESTNGSKGTERKITVHLYDEDSDIKIPISIEEVRDLFNLLVALLEGYQPEFVTDNLYIKIASGQLSSGRASFTIRLIPYQLMFENIAQTDIEMTVDQLRDILIN